MKQKILLYRALPERDEKHCYNGLLALGLHFSENGKGWGHKRGDLKPPENTLIFESRVDQAFCRYFLCTFHGSCAMKNA